MPHPGGEKQPLPETKKAQRDDTGREEEDWRPPSKERGLAKSRRETLREELREEGRKGTKVLVRFLMPLGEQLPQNNSGLSQTV